MYELARILDETQYLLLSSYDQGRWRTESSHYIVVEETVGAMSFDSAGSKVAPADSLVAGGTTTLPLCLQPWFPRMTSNSGWLPFPGSTKLRVLGMAPSMSESFPSDAVGYP